MHLGSFYFCQDVRLICREKIFSFLFTILNSNATIFLQCALLVDLKTMHVSGGLRRKLNYTVIISSKHSLLVFAHYCCVLSFIFDGLFFCCFIYGAIDDVVS